ncbi:MAG TPA: DUF1127 domain-containing protein [Alphaproteobacteria bacterium]|nr:DUF1127 domain-containing protein [Alphaproteobacteria bacterium]
MLHNLARRIIERMRINRDIARLSRLDDRLLTDIGVARCEIAAAVRGER